MFQNITPFLNYFYSRLGKYGVIGIGLLFSGLLLIYFNDSHQHKKSSLLNEELSELKRKNISNSGTKTRALDSLVDINFPDKSSLHDTLELIQNTAQKNNIQIESVDYKLTELPSIHAFSYDVSLPVYGKYIDIKKFMRELSQNNKAIIVKDIALSRDDNQVNDLNGLLQLVLYFRN